jgi:ParB-like chromosome segregation protein Spo0J
MTESYLDIGDKRFLVREEEVPVRDLLFYVDNPRVYSMLHNDGEAPTQEEIEEYMLGMEHVKELRQSIEQVGLIDPLIVRDGDFVVLEGNSRLAAYRKLAKKNPIKWGKVKCKILPANIDNDTIIIILGQYHIVGRKDWSPFEQAGFILRGLEDTKYPIDELAQKLGISTTAAKKYVRVYEYMREHDDLVPAQWSHYEEFLKNRSIQEEIKTNAALEERVVAQIKQGEIHEAADIRKLGEIIKTKSKPAKRALGKYVEGKVSLNSAYEELKDSGQINDVLQKLQRFKEYINDTDLDGKITEAQPDLKKKLEYEIKGILRRLSRLQNSSAQ